MISHCFFNDRENRDKSCTAYNKLFRYLLSPNGYVLLIIQVNKLCGLIGAYPEENLKLERQAIDFFLDSLGLELVSHNYLTSTGKRKVAESEFRAFSKNNLPPQKNIYELMPTAKC